MSKYGTKEKQNPFPRGIETEDFSMAFNLEKKTNSIKEVELKVGSKEKTFRVVPGNLLSLFPELVSWASKNLDLTKNSRKKEGKKSHK